jgi:hypothetical protein
MYARVVRWEGAQAGPMRASAQQIAAQSGDGPPEGVPAKAFTLLIDPDEGRSLAIVLFETEEDMRVGDATLNQMNPPDDAMGKRASVEFYEVAMQLTVP